LKQSFAAGNPTLKEGIARIENGVKAVASIKE
jgi:hypothetical protein